MGHFSDRVNAIFPSYTCFDFRATTPDRGIKTAKISCLYIVALMWAFLCFKKSEFMSIKIEFGNQEFSSVTIVNGMYVSYLLATIIYISLD
jgi:hypothetical protein